MVFEILIYDTNSEKIYAQMGISCDSYGEMMDIASAKCQEIMEKYNLDDVCWNYKEVPYIG
jgi:hypothetical protein